MTSEPKKTPMGAVQKERLLQAARLTAAAYATKLESWAIDAHPDERLKNEASYNADLSYFNTLLELRGLLPGDRIRYTTEGRYYGAEGVISDQWYEFDDVLAVTWPEGSPFLDGDSDSALAGEVELVHAETLDVPRETSES